MGCRPFAGKEKDMREIDKEEKNLRYIVFVVMVAAVFLGIVARLFSLQILNAQVYEEKALQNRVRRNIIKPKRGQIYDREGALLAKNITGYKVIHSHTENLDANDVKILKEIQNMDLSKAREHLYATLKPRAAEKLYQTIYDVKKISEITGYTTDYIIGRFFKQERIGTDKVILVIEDLDKKIALKAIEKIDNDRINIVEYNKRLYPEDQIASHVIGYIKPITEKEYENLKKEGYQNDDMVGKKGVERFYDKLMRGQDGISEVEVDAKGNIIRELKSTSSIAGKDVYLSINLELQKRMTKSFEGRPGAFIAMEAKTGKIITFVSNPEISLNLLSSRIPDDQWNQLVNSKAKPLVNKGISGLYPPGSTFKAVTGLGILESGISPNDGVVSTGAYKYGGISFRDARRFGHGWSNFSKSIEESVNTYYYHFSQKAGVDNIVKYSKELGIGEKTGVDISGESAGTLPSPEWKKKRFKKKEEQKWLPGDLINMSIGQGYVLTTPLQIASVYQIIANDGVMLRPTVVDRFVNFDGKVEIKQPEVVRKVAISDRNIKLMQNALRLPVSGYGGTAKVLRNNYFSVSAKTGTAQNTGFQNHHSWIAGYFPSDNPEIVFVSIVEGGGYGGIASGQQAKRFIEAYVDVVIRKKGSAEDKDKEKEKDAAKNNGKKN